MQVCSLTTLTSNHDEIRSEAGLRPCNDAHRRAYATPGNLQRRVFPLSYDRSPRHPFEGAPYAILQIWKNAAPVIAMAHRVNRRIAEVRQVAAPRLFQVAVPWRAGSVEDLRRPMLNAPGCKLMDLGDLASDHSGSDLATRIRGSAPESVRGFHQSRSARA